MFSRILLLIILLSLQNCFEYEEVIHFNKGFTGFVEITYTVPVNPKTEKSLIRHLPLFQEEIEKRINKGIFSKNLKIRDYNIQYIEKNPEDANSFYFKKAKVNYKLDFVDLVNLDGILVGYLFVKRKNNNIQIKREFKSVLKVLDQNSTPGEKKIHSETLRLLGDGSINFKVLFPISSECRSSKGEIGLGSLSYKFPLLDTVEKPGIKTWDYSITTL